MSYAETDSKKSFLSNNWFLDIYLLTKNVYNFGFSEWKSEN